MVFEYELDIVYGTNENVTLSMPKDILLLTYHNEKSEERIVECVCSQNISFKFNSNNSYVNIYNMEIINVIKRINLFNSN